jgi:hypothetical protein
LSRIELDCYVRQGATDRGEYAKLPELLRKVELLGLLQAATADSEKNFPNIQYG